MKVYYRPPKVKPSKNKSNKPLPEWNSTINNLDQYKLTSSEVLKRKINSVSKNLDFAKEAIQDNYEKAAQIQIKQKTNKIKEKEKTENLEDLSLEKVIEKYKENKSKSINKTKKKTETNKTRDKTRINLNVLQKEKESDEDEIKMDSKVKIVSTKIEKNEFEDRINNLTNLSKHKLNVDDFNLSTEKNISNDFKTEKNKNLGNNLKKSNFNYLEDDIQDDGNILDFNENLIKKFDNLTNIEDSMKKLNQILDFSVKSSYKAKYENEFNDKRDINKVVKNNPDIMEEEEDNLQDILFNTKKDDNLNMYLQNPIPNANPNKTPLPKNKDNYSNNINNSAQAPKNVYEMATRKVEINRKIIDVDSAHKTNSNNYLNPMEDDNIKYLKDILLKTKNEIDTMFDEDEDNQSNHHKSSSNPFTNSNYSNPYSNSYSNSQTNNYNTNPYTNNKQNFDEDLEPRRLPTLISSNKYK